MWRTYCMTSSFLEIIKLSKHLQQIRKLFLAAAVQRREIRLGGKFSSSPPWNIGFSICLNKPTVQRGKVEREKHTNLFPISFLISAENDVLWPVISFNSFIWVIIMDIVISTEPDTSKWKWADGGGRGGEEGRGGSAGGWTLRYDGSTIITVTFLHPPRHCPCRPTLISAYCDWQPTSRTLE